MQTAFRWDLPFGAVSLLDISGSQLAALFRAAFRNATAEGHVGTPGPLAQVSGERALAPTMWADPHGAPP